MNVEHLRQRLIQSGVLSDIDSLSIDDVKEMLYKKFDGIDYENAKADVFDFIKDKRLLDVWSADFFKAIAKVWNKGWDKLLAGVGNTLLIALVSTVIGLLIGLVIGVIRTIPKSRNRFVRGIMKTVDVMVQAMVIYWGYAFSSGGQTLPLLPSAIFIVSINTGAYMAEIVRGGIISIDRGQFEGAISIGMNHFQTMVYVVIPQLMKNILPSVANEFVINIKDTSVLNVIGVTELFYQATVLSKMTYEIFATYAIISVLYLAMTLTITKVLRLFEKLLTGKNNYTIMGSQSDPSAEIHIEGGKENV